MKFVDLKELKTHKEYHYNTVAIDLGEANELLNSNPTELFEVLKDAADGLVNEPILFTVELENCADEEEFHHLVNVIIDNLMAILTTQEKREREGRLGVPKTFRETVHCNNLPLQKMINNKTIVDVFAITITDTKKGWVYDIVSR